MYIHTLCHTHIHTLTQTHTHTYIQRNTNTDNYISIAHFTTYIYLQNV